MTQRLSGLESRLRLALRAVYPAPEGSRERVRERLAATLVSLDASSGTSRGAGRQDMDRAATRMKAGPGAALRSSAFSAGKISALALVGGIAGATLLAAVEGRRPAQIVYVDRAAAQASAVAAPVPVAEPIQGTSALAESGTPSGAPPSAPPATSAAGASRRAHAPGSSTFAAEQALLDQARAALVQGDPQRAMGLLGRHRTRFANGLLAEEREAMRVEALVAESRYPEARAAAQAFRARNPHSLFLATVDSAVESVR